MKTKTILIIGIIVAVIAGFFAYVSYQVNECMSMPGYWHNPRMNGWWGCFGYLQTQDVSPVDESVKKYLLCAKKFDEIYEEFASSLSCESQTGATCEPELFGPQIRSDEEFLKLNCGADLERWAYLSQYNDVAWDALGPKYEVMVDQYYNLGEPIDIALVKHGFKRCDSFRAEVIDRSDKSVMWQRDSTNSCVVLDTAKWNQFTYPVTVPSQQLTIEKPGEYRVFIYLKDEHDPQISGYFGVLPEKKQ